MKKLILLSVCVLLSACHNADEDPLTLTSKFQYTWNLYETVERDGDGIITYHAQPWGGLAASFKERNMPVDWSRYESITFEFAEPTKVPTQIMVSDRLTTWGKAGIKSLTCNFDGQDMTSIGEVALQASDTTTLYVKRVFLTMAGAVWDSSPIWTGKCEFGNWSDGFVIKGEQFTTAMEGDKLEFVYRTETDDPTINYWQFKTVYNTTDSTLEGNENELNRWGCATVGKESRVYRITLTANDVTKLREYGVFVNGFYITVTQCNQLRKNDLSQEGTTE